jgi:hypothetical protein
MLTAHRAGSLAALLLAALVTFFGHAPAARGGAWTFAEHSGQLILTTLYYQAEHTFTRGGGRRAFDHDGSFTKWEFNPYLEYGLRNDVTLMASIFLREVEFTNRFGGDRNFGLADPELALRYRLSAPESRTVWSIQGLVKLPVATSSATPPLGNEQTDVEARLLVGRGFSIGGHGAFWNVEGAFRFRDEAPADEVRLDATLGYDVTPNWLVLGQFFGLKGVGNSSPSASPGNPSLETDYDLYKAQVSVVYRIAPSIRLQVGYLRDLAGRNTGAGQGALFALWLRF